MRGKASPAYNGSMAIDTTSAVEVRRKLTPDDVRRMLESGELGPDATFELVDGEVMALPPAFGDHGRTELDIATALHIFARAHGGCAFAADTGFMVGPQRRDLRAPDAAYIGPDRVQESYPHFIDGAPDLAVEVLSGDQYGDAYARTKVREYLDADGQLVWLVDRRRREVRVYRAGAEEYTTLRGDAVLTLEPIVTGFALRVRDILW